MKLSKGKLPSYVDTYCRIRNHTFIEDGRVIVALCNPTNEKLDNVIVAIRTSARKAELYTHQAMVKTVYAETGEMEQENYRFFTVDQIPPYEMVIIEA